MIIETLQPENQVLTSIFHALAENGLISIEGDDEEMSETTLHFKLIHYLYAALKLFLADRENCFVAANLRISYDDENPLKWYAPDVLVAFGVENRERRSYSLSSEKVMPQVVFEVASIQTADVDLGKKYVDYARLGVKEYYLLDVERQLLSQSLMAYQTKNGKLVPIEIHRQRIFSPLLNLEIVDTGDAFRLFNPANNEFLRSTEELAVEAARVREVEARLAELEALLKQQQN